jgi:hypothetical protein
MESGCQKDIMCYDESELCAQKTILIFNSEHHNWEGLCDHLRKKEKEKILTSDSYTWLYISWNSTPLILKLEIDNLWEGKLPQGGEDY